MPVAISKYLIAALALGTVHALPQPKLHVPRQAEPTLAHNPDPHDNTELLTKLKTDTTAIKRFQRLLTDDGQQLLNAEDLAKATVFDFQKTTSPVPGSQGGSVSTSSVDSFPILLESGITMSYATLGPCGLFLPHVHPRANEYFVVVDGEVDFGYMLEIGLLKNAEAPNPEITGKLIKYTGTLFPQGSVHYQINNSPDCTPATIFTTLGSEDPGTTTVLQSPSGGNATVVQRQVDGMDVADFRPVLPAQIVKVIDECLARCNPAKA